MDDTLSAQVADVERARAGDEAAFTRLVAPLHTELRAYCYRILGSVHDADDALQDALLRAWRAFGRFEGRSSLRTWLYTVATRTSLDLAEARGRRALPMDLGPASERAVVEGNDPVTDVAWLGPYPGNAADDRYLRRESVELAFVAALQHLPGNQRAALVLAEVLGFSSAEIAEIMKTSATSVSSAIARARRTLEAKLPGSSPPSTDDGRLRQLATGFADALINGDPDALLALLCADVTWTMPPLPHWYRGREAVVDFAVEVPMTRCPSWRYLLTTANGLPAVAFYLGEHPEASHQPWSITAFTARHGLIATITSFIGAGHFPPFGLPAALPGPAQV
ncbi:RNA polymerase subunit sigma-70 [Crossiella sp. CA-258035]|uniref:RNA polymerase subunit sigma-70 n=1 Tax=Crossiella sp. CA-258035 TaxID=2981138 RepID=UPI0024BCB67B|nr:RNA polymerase subunit sigma-70 [Crossiella sp. CA-258035]WHT22990.1 RNA polymerase subunit sigma-70 [Crossiella sp. CA-258035]